MAIRQDSEALQYFFFKTGFCQKFRMGIPPCQSWDWKLPKSSNKWNFTWPRLRDVRAVVFSDSYFRILPGHIRTHQDAVRLCPISARKKWYCKEWFNRMYLISSNMLIGKAWWRGRSISNKIGEMNKNIAGWISKYVRLKNHRLPKYGYQRMNIDKTWQQLGKTFGGGYGNVIAMYRLTYI